MNKSAPDDRARLPAAKVLIVDDHPVVRLGLSALIKAQPDLKVCGEAGDVAGAVRAFERERPDVAVVDVSLQDGDGLELIKRLRSQDPSFRSIVWSMFPEGAYAERALRAGAMGYVHKGREIREILRAIRAVLQGRLYLTDGLSADLLQRLVRSDGRAAGGSPVDDLSDRELETFRLIGEGLTTDQIAARMGLSPKTVETYRLRIKEKLGLSTIPALIQQAARWVLEN